MYSEIEFTMPQTKQKPAAATAALRPRLLHLALFPSNRKSAI